MGSGFKNRIYIIALMTAILVGLTQTAFAEAPQKEFSVKLTPITKVIHTVRMHKYSKILFAPHDEDRVIKEELFSSKVRTGERLKSENGIKGILEKEAKAKKKAYQEAEEKKKWKKGVATAYGDHTDPYSIGYAKSGDPVTNSSMGVAVPYETGRTLFGKKIEIEYNGVKVTGVINDWVSSEGVALSLQPGIVHTLGFNTAAGWGVREVKYKIIN